ncbi:MAG: SLBB domain-containing protein [Thiolinea sp.]
MNLAKTMLATVVAAALLSGCIFDKKVKLPPLTERNAINAALPDPAPALPLSTRPVPAALTYTPGVYPVGIKAGSDVLQIRDLLEITVFKVPDLTRELRIANDGSITFPLIGRVQAQGRTPAALEREIAAKLETNFINNPQVTVVVKESVQNRVTVEGAVKQPGVFPVTGSMTVLQAVALAGGLDPKADARRAVLLRRNARGQISQQPIDIAAIRRGQMQDLMLLQDDRIVIPEGTYNRFTVSGAVASPGVFELREGMTLLQAVAMAGGMTRLADKKQAIVFRRDRNGEFRRYKVNLQAIHEGRAMDPELGADDRLVVLESRGRVLLEDASRYITPPRLF